MPNATDEMWLSAWNSITTPSAPSERTVSKMRISMFLSWRILYAAVILYMVILTLLLYVLSLRLDHSL